MMRGFSLIQVDRVYYKYLQICEMEEREITVYVKLSDGTADILSVASSTTVMDFIDLVRQTQNMHDQLFELYYENKHLADIFKTLADYGINEHSKIAIKNMSNSFINERGYAQYHLLINWQDKNLEFGCPPTIYVQQVLVQLAAAFPEQNFNPRKYTLYYKGVQLELDRKIISYQIPAASQLYVVVRKANSCADFDSEIPISESYYIPRELEFVQSPKKEIKNIRIVHSGVFQDQTDDTQKLTVYCSSPRSQAYEASSNSGQFIIEQSQSSFGALSEKWNRAVEVRQIESGSEQGYSAFRLSGAAVYSQMKYLEKLEINCNQIQLTQSFDMKEDLESLDSTQVKTHSIRLTDKSRGKIYRISFLDKNSIRDLKEIIADVQKITPEDIKLRNPESQQEYDQNCIFKDILQNGPQKMIILISNQKVQTEVM